MTGFLALMLTLMALIWLVSYWMSWEIQHKERRGAFATKLRDDVTHFIGGESGGISTSGAVAIAMQSKQNRTHARRWIARRGIPNDS